MGGASSHGPVAIVGPDRKLVLPLTSLLLNGTESTSVQGIISYHWDTIRWFIRVVNNVCKSLF